MSKTNVNLRFVPSYHFTSSLTKEKIEDVMSIIMSESGVQVFGYKRHEDEYWGKLKINKNEHFHFTLTLKKAQNSTTIIVNSFNATITESKTFSLKLCEIIKTFENTQSIYKKKHLNFLNF